MESLGNIAEKIIFDKKNTLPFVDIFLNWQDIVGESFAEISEPYKVLNMKTGKVLCIKSKCKCAVELQHSSAHLIKIINDYLKKETFIAIRVIQDSSE